MITGACMFYLFNSLFVSSAAGRLTVQPSPRRPSILDLAEDNGHHHDEKPTARVTRTRENQQNFHGRVQRYFHTAYQILLLILAVNTGAALWMQQFCAMFLKRLYNSVRFVWGVIWQLILPVLFILLGLILAKTLPGRNSDDPKRLLSLTNSAPSNNLTLFWAQFISGTPSLDLSVSTSDIICQVKKKSYSGRNLLHFDSAKMCMLGILLFYLGWCK